MSQKTSRRSPGHRLVSAHAPGVRAAPGRSCEGRTADVPASWEQEGRRHGDQGTPRRGLAGSDKSVQYLRNKILIIYFHYCCCSFPFSTEWVLVLFIETCSTGLSEGVRWGRSFQKIESPFEGFYFSLGLSVHTSVGSAAANPVLDFHVFLVSG